MIKNKKPIKKIKQEILENLEDLKEFEVNWGEEVFYSIRVKAKNKEEAENKFNDGEVIGTDKDIVDCNVIENSLEVDEVE